MPMKNVYLTNMSGETRCGGLYISYARRNGAIHFYSTTTSDADKVVCITNLTDLNDETLRLLKITNAAQQ
jgi:hypothetical protein